MERKCQVEMPIGAEILSVQVQDHFLTAWAMVNPEAHKTPGMMEYRHFKVLMTGEEFVDNGHYKYIGTVQRAGIVAHVLEDRFYHNKR